VLAVRGQAYGLRGGRVLDLANVDLIAVSACQTALGRVEQGGEMLGLRRAFQLAGARSAVTSRWATGRRACWWRSFTETCGRRIWGSSRRYVRRS
jgi:hypothetical protein